MEVRIGRPLGMRNGMDREGLNQRYENLEVRFCVSNWVTVCIVLSWIEFDFSYLLQRLLRL